MKRRQRQTVLLTLVQFLQNYDIPCRDSTLQPTVYILQNVLGIPLGFMFALYKEAPYSFQLRNEVMAMLADELVQLQYQPYPDSPTLVVTDAGRRLQDRYPKTLHAYMKTIHFVADSLDRFRLDVLKRIATTHYRYTMKKRQAEHDDITKEESEKTEKA